LGYADRHRSEEDRKLVEAAEQAVSDSWKLGRTVALPPPPHGCQWNLPSTAGNSEEAEKAVVLTASFDRQVGWNFTIAGLAVEAFDARPVISPCLLDPRSNDLARSLSEKHRELIDVALYNSDGATPKIILESMKMLNVIAVNSRSNADGISEGHVYDWLPIARNATHVSSAIWRDTILAIKTREGNDVTLGPVSSDGICRRDMTEGSLLRVFHVLESLYPTSLIKTGAIKWTVRTRGAAYLDMISSLERLCRIVQPGRAIELLSAAEDCRITELFGERPRRAASSPKLAQDVVQSGTDVDDKSSTAQDDITDHEEHEAGLREDDEVDFEGDALYDEASMETDDESLDKLPLPCVLTKLWSHQEASVAKVLEGIANGRRGHADASAVGAGKTLTALATIVKVQQYMDKIKEKRCGALVMVPSIALVKEWLLQIAEHTVGFHVVEQREDGRLHSLTYGKSTPPPPIDGNTIVISTLDRVREHPFARQSAWDFVVIDECLAVQNGNAKRCPSAWRQIEVSSMGVLMLSATFFRSRYSDLFYMIRMLRTPFPRTMEWLSATIHEHIVCQIPETDRSWKMEGRPVPLPAQDLILYRRIVETFKRKQLNSGKGQDPRRLFADLEGFVRKSYEGREGSSSYARTSVMAEAVMSACDDLIKEGRRPLIFADTAAEAEHILSFLQANRRNARLWSAVANGAKFDIIVAVKTVEGSGINMQRHADSIVCRPTPGDHLEQMKGRVDRPGQKSKELKLVVLMAEHTFEEAKYAK
jgi:superfamily II DNA or RNA helicase